MKASTRAGFSTMIPLERFLFDPGRTEPITERFENVRITPTTPSSKHAVANVLRNQKLIDPALLDESRDLACAW